MNLSPAEINIMLDALEAREGALDERIEKMLGKGFPQESPRIVYLTARLAEVRTLMAKLEG